MGCASASGVSVDRCLRFPSCMVFVSFGTVRRSSFQHLRPFVTAPLYGRRSSRLSTAPAVCIFAPSFSLLLPRPPGPFCEIAHLVCAVHCVLLRLSVSAVSGICLCFTGVPATHCLACGFFRNGPNQIPILSSELHAPQSSGPDQYPESFLPGVPTPNCSAGPRTFSFPSIQEVLHLPQAFPAKSVG